MTEHEDGKIEEKKEEEKQGKRSNRIPFWHWHTSSNICAPHGYRILVCLAHIRTTRLMTITFRCGRTVNTLTAWKISFFFLLLLRHKYETFSVTIKFRCWWNSSNALSLCTFSRGVKCRSIRMLYGNLDIWKLSAIRHMPNCKELKCDQKVVWFEWRLTIFGFCRNMGKINKIACDWFSEFYFSCDFTNRIQGKKIYEYCARLSKRGCIRSISLLT